MALLAAVIAVLSFPAGASALSGPQFLNFSEFGEGTEISTQYAPVGIVFAGEDGFDPEIRWDRSSYTNPTLGGPFGFGSTIEAKFVEPGTFTPATVENLSMDVGQIDDPGSTAVTIERLSGPVVFYTDEYGFDEIGIAANDITGFRVESVENEPAGWELDNVSYFIPAPPPPPPPPPAPAPVAAPPAAPSCPTYAIYDSRGSGETWGTTSKPGRKFIPAFEARLASLHKPNSVAVTDNPYPAVGVISKTKPGDDLNGIGAYLGVHSLGAYYDSENEGSQKVISWLKKQLAGACGTTSKIVLLGYSQGAQATADAYEQIYKKLSTGQRHQIAAVVLWGDPRYNHKDRLADRDDRNGDGVLGTRPLLPNDAQQQKDSKLFSYCNNRDIFCQTFNLAEMAYLGAREHKLYYTTDEAKNDGSAVASFVSKH